MKEKKAEMSIGVIIALVLGILILVLSIYMLTTQKAIFKEETEAISSETNVDSVVLACNSLVDTESVYSYCCETKDVVTVDERLEMTCDDFAKSTISSERIKFLGCETTTC